MWEARIIGKCYHFVTGFIALFVLLMRQLHCDCRRWKKTKQDRTQYSKHNISPSIKLSALSTLSRCDQLDLQLLAASSLTRVTAACRRHAAYSWAKKSDGWEEVFMIKSIVWWHNNTQLISSLAWPAAMDPSSEKYGNSSICSIKDMRKDNIIQNCGQIQNLNQTWLRPNNLLLNFNSR